MSALRQRLLDLSSRGLRMPIGTDLVLRERADADAVVLDGQRLGEVFCEAARRYHTPLAIPLMDLTLEKESLLTWLGIPAEQAPTYHFAQAPAESMLDRLEERPAEPLSPRLAEQAKAIRYVASQPDLVPIGMAIGPFSLMTKLIADPIVAVYLAATGVTGEEDAEVLNVERCLELSVRTVLRSIRLQLEAGARAVMVAEPAANKVYVSPAQMEKGSDVFDRLVLTFNQQVRDLLASYDAELLFHCCGEITEAMLKGFCTLAPALLSLGSSRTLWEDAAIVPKSIVLYGNLPSKKFFSDTEITAEKVRDLGGELLRNMREAGHPFILGSECDVLHVAGCEAPIHRKVAALLEC